MTRPPETPEDTAHRHTLEMRESLRRAGRTYLRYAENHDGRRYTIGVNDAQKRAKARADTDDLPKDLKKARPKLQDTYRALRALSDGRRDLPDPRVPAAEIVAWLDAHEIDAPNSIYTIGHALTDLKTLQLAWNADDAEGGWYFGRNPALPPAALPRENRQSERASTSAAAGYAGRRVGEGADLFSGATTMSKKRIWVPGVKDEYQKGVVVVTDAVTEAEVGVNERVGTMKVPTRLGTEFRCCAAVRGDLVRIDGKYAVVKLPGGHEVRTRILGDWHLEGLTEPADAEPTNAA